MNSSHQTRDETSHSSSEVIRRFERLHRIDDNAEHVHERSDNFKHALKKSCQDSGQRAEEMFSSLTCNKQNLSNVLDVEH
jgi:hypothetical protein